MESPWAIQGASLAQRGAAGGGRGRRGRQGGWDVLWDDLMFIPLEVPKAVFSNLHQLTHFLLGRSQIVRFDPRGKHKFHVLRYETLGPKARYKDDIWDDHLASVGTRKIFVKILKSFLKNVMLQ